MTKLISYTEELKKQFPTETAFQIALYAYIYNGKYKEELKILKEQLNEYI